MQKGAPAKLLVGTDLLSQLGYLFIQTSEDNHDCDMLVSVPNITDDLRGSSTTRSEQGGEMS